MREELDRRKDSEIDRCEFPAPSISSNKVGFQGGGGERRKVCGAAARIPVKTTGQAPVELHRNQRDDNAHGDVHPRKIQVQALQAKD